MRDGDKVLAAQQVTLAADGQTQTENLLFNVGAAGAKSLQFTLDPLPGETNTANNTVARLVNVESDQRRVLYVEGEPRWEYKFIRRAEDDDHSVQLVSMLRTTENKIYRQGIDDPKELADGFPTKAEDLFKYQGLIIGSVEANYFTPAQQDLIQQFVDVRGGGALLLAGSSSLADGGWSASSMANLLPVVAAEPQGHVSPRSGDGSTDADRRRQHHLPPGGRFRPQRRALEEAAVPDELPGSRARPSRAPRCWRR